MDGRIDPDELHPVRWSPASGTEPDSFISLDEAVRRIGGYTGIPGDVIEQELRNGYTHRTPFAFYRWHTVEDPE